MSEDDKIIGIWMICMIGLPLVGISLFAAYDFYRMSDFKRLVDRRLRHQKEWKTTREFIKKL